MQRWKNKLSPWWLLVLLYGTDYMVVENMMPTLGWEWLILFLMLINGCMLALWWLGLYSQGGVWRSSWKSVYKENLGYPLQVLNQLNRLVVGLDSAGRILWANRVAGDVLGDRLLKALPAADIKGSVFFDYISTSAQICARGRKTVLEDNREVVGLPKCSLVLKEGDGQLSSWTGRVHLVSKGAAELVYVVDLEKEESTMVVDVAMTDDLTGLYNRRFADQKVEHLMSNQVPFVLYFIDLDRFKAVNDTYGHEAGDLVLQETGRRIKDIVRESDFAIRMGGDEFHVLIVGELAIARIQAIGEQLVAALNQPMHLGNLEVRISASIGVARYPLDGTSTKDLVAKADFAMYSAKVAGKNAFLFFDEKHDRELMRKKKLQEGIKRVIESNELTISFVPIMDRELGCVTIGEVESSWAHPELGRVAHAEVQRIACEFSLGQDLGRLLMQEGLKWLQAVQKREKGLRSLKVAVPLVTAQLQSSLFCQQLMQECKARGLRHSDVVLEVKESVLLSNDAVALHNLRQLGEVGFSLALDDFGMGHSPLTCFYDFKFRYLKLDAKVTSNLQEHKFRKLVQTLRSIADAMELTIVAKGIDVPDHEDEFKRLRIELYQGSLYGDSLTADEFEQSSCVYSCSLVLPESAQLGVADDFFN